MTTDAAAAPVLKRPAGLGGALLILYAVVFLNLAGFGLVVPLLPFFAKSLHAEAWQVTLMFSAYSLGQFFAEPFWGRLSDRVGRKPVLIVTTLVNVVGYVALAFAPDIWTAVVVRLVTGLGSGNISTIQGYVADVSPPQLRAGRLGYLGAAFGLGFVIGPGGGLLLGPHAGREGFQLLLFGAAGLCALACLGVTLFVKESRTVRDPAAKRPAFLSGFGDAVRNPVISRVLPVTLVYMGAFSGMESTFGLWTQARFGWGVREVSLAFVVVGVVSALSQALLTGRLARAFGEARVLAVGISLFGLSLLIQFLAREAWMVPVVMCFGAFGMSLAMPNISALISRASPPDRQGALLGLNMAAASSARILGPVIAGQLFSRIGPGVPLLVGACLTAPAAILAVNAGIAFKKSQAAPQEP
jgi:MFS family permease